MPILFADDTNLFCTGVDLKNMIRQVNEELAKIYAWVNANKLSLNIDKTNFMLFMSKYSSHCADHIDINQTRIQEEKETKFLGVIIDNKLKWSAHIKYISKNLPKVLVSYWNQERFSVMRPFYQCTTHLYYPYLSCCIHVWGNAYNTHLNDLIVQQNKAMRIINGVPPRTNMDNDYIEKNTLTVKHIFSYNIGLFMFKYVNNVTGYIW